MMQMFTLILTELIGHQSDIDSFSIIAVLTISPAVIHISLY